MWMSPQSHVFRQAENRMHAQNALMVFCSARHGREHTTPQGDCGALQVGRHRGHGPAWVYVLATARRHGGAKDLGEEHKSLMVQPAPTPRVISSGGVAPRGGPWRANVGLGNVFGLNSEHVMCSPESLRRDEHAESAEMTTKKYALKVVVPSGPPGYG